jgi:hypothetical protein
MACWAVMGAAAAFAAGLSAAKHGEAANPLSAAAASAAGKRTPNLAIELPPKQLLLKHERVFVEHTSHQRPGAHRVGGLELCMSISIVEKVVARLLGFKHASDRALYRAAVNARSARRTLDKMPAGGGRSGGSAKFSVIPQAGISLPVGKRLSEHADDE